MTEDSEGAHQEVLGDFGAEGAEADLEIEI
jgi:hypothetical protein